MAVESTNIVGYIDKEAEANVYTPVSVMLDDIGYNTLAITSIVFDGVSRGDTIQIFGNDGNVATEISYGRSGWDDEDYVFLSGDSFWFLPSDSVSITFPGQVDFCNLVIEAEGNVYTPMGNGTAAPVAITAIEFDGISRGDTIQIFDNAGNVETEIAYGREGWDDGDYVFQPGDAFWLLPSDDVTVTFPGPTAN